MNIEIKVLALSSAMRVNDLRKGTAETIQNAEALVAWAEGKDAEVAERTLTILSGASFRRFEPLLARANEVYDFLTATPAPPEPMKKKRGRPKKIVD